jgi:hypothetical protein
MSRNLPAALLRAVHALKSRPVVADETPTPYHSPYAVQVHNSAFGQRSI